MIGGDTTVPVFARILVTVPSPKLATQRQHLVDVNRLGPRPTGIAFLYFVSCVGETTVYRVTLFALPSTTHSL